PDRVGPRGARRAPRRRRAPGPRHARPLDRRQLPARRRRGRGAPRPRRRARPPPLRARPGAARAARLRPPLAPRPRPRPAAASAAAPHVAPWLADHDGGVREEAVRFVQHFAIGGHGARLAEIVADTEHGDAPRIAALETLTSLHEDARLRAAIEVALADE